MTRRIIITLLLLGAPFILGLAVTYELIQVDFTGFMEDQPSIGYREGPRLLPPEGAIPITGLEVPADGSVPTNPVTNSENSMARGNLLFDIHCAVCHGDKALGDGPVAPYFKSPAPPVADLTTDRIRNLDDGLIYLILTNGAQGMPSLAENLTPRERWDVINYLRTLQNTQVSSSMNQ